jgi:hypothetical protein
MALSMRLALVFGALALFATAHAGGSDAPVGDFDESDVVVISSSNFDEKVLGSKFALVSSQKSAARSCPRFPQPRLL